MVDCDERLVRGSPRFLLDLEILGAKRDTARITVKRRRYKKAALANPSEVELLKAEDSASGGFLYHITSHNRSNLRKNVAIDSSRYSN